MTATQLKRAVVWVLAMAVVGTAAAADLTIVSKVTPSKGAPYTSTQYIAADKMRMSDGDNDTIIDLSAGTIVQIDHTKKSYFETSFEEMQQHFAQLSDMIAANPMMEGMFGTVNEVQVDKTGETREILGRSCTKYVMTMGEKFRETLWVTSELKMPLQYYDAAKMTYAMMGPMATRFEKMLEEMKEIDGFPLATDVDMSFMGMDASSISEVTEVREGSIPADVFTVPAGYKKKKSPMGK